MTIYDYDNDFAHYECNDEERKKLGQVWTPYSVIEKMMDKIVYEDLNTITFNTVDSTLWHKGIVMPSMNISAGANRYFNYESSALVDSTTAYNFVAVDGYDIYKATISASGSQGFTTLTGYTSSYCPPQIAIVSTSSQIPASGSSDNRVWIVTGV